MPVTQTDDRIRVFTLERGCASLRLDAFLASVAGVARSQIRRHIDQGLVVVDGVIAVKAGVKLSAGQVVQWQEPVLEPLEAIAQEIPLSVAYEDHDLIVVDKPAGMVVHPAAGNPDGTMVNALLAHCSDLAGIGGVIRPGIVHRLDKDTSGLIVAAKNDAAQNGLAEQFAEHSIERVYETFVYGQYPEEVARIEANIGRHSKDRKRFAVVDGHGKHAVTHIECLAIYGQISHLRVKLETGRTHQIRVHLSHQGYPVVGDPLYCPSRRARRVIDKTVHDAVAGIKRQMLHAGVLGFTHPILGSQLRFVSGYPTDMQQLLDVLASYYGAS